jgi:hypothetical protein
MKKSLRTFSKDLHSEFQDEDIVTESKMSIVDFNSAGLYIGGLQAVAGVGVASCTSILSCWILPNSIVSGVRTLVATSLLSFLVVFKAIRVGRVRGVSMLFAALRPCVFIYLLALTLEELGHGSCKQDQEDEHATARRIVYHICTVIMLISAFMRAQSPRSESDYPFVMTVLCLSVIAVLPMPSSSSHGPLSQSPKTLIDAGERVLRATLFSFTYSMHVYASAPTQNIGSELLVCVGRAASASVWILCVSPIILIAFPIQAVLCIAMSVHMGSKSNSMSVTEHAYESVPLKAPTLGEEAHKEIMAACNSHPDIMRCESDTEEASMSCSSDIESDAGIRRYGAFSQLGNASTVPSSSFSALNANHRSSLFANDGCSYNSSTSSSATAPTISFSFRNSNLQQISNQSHQAEDERATIGNGPTPAMIAAAIARESA